MTLLLSICIATRNRAEFICETLTSILTQVDDHRNSVEVLVCDGASSDGTAEAVERMAAANPALRLLRQGQNGGVDKDYDLAVIAAQGHHVWLMTDDDTLEPGAVARVLAACHQGHQLIVVDALVCGPDLQQVLQPRRLPFGGERVYAAGAPELLADLGDHLTFIGSVVIRRDLWLAREREPYYGSLFIHVGVIFQAALPGSALAIGEPLVRIRYGLGGWKPRRFEVWMFLWPQLIWSFAGYPASTRQQVVAQEPWRRIQVLANYRAKGAYGLAEYRHYIVPRLGPGPRRFASLAVACIPGRLLNGLALLLASLGGRGLGSGSMDLRASVHYWRRMPWT